VFNWCKLWGHWIIANNNNNHNIEKNVLLKRYCDYVIAAIDSFVENSKLSINTNRNSPVPLDVNGVVSKIIRPVSATSVVEIPAVSVIDHGHTGNDRFRISGSCDKNDGFDEMTHGDEGLVIAQKIAATFADEI